MTEEISSSISSIPTNEPEQKKCEVTITEKIGTESVIDSSSSSWPPPFRRISVPIENPSPHLRETITIVVWFFKPWLCLYISFLLLRCDNWYVVGTFIIYLSWMVFFSKISKRRWIKTTMG